MNTKTTLLSLSNVGKTYGTGKYSFEALKDVNLDIEKGEFVAILGPSGSGKSTLLNVIGGMDKITTGKLLFQGNDLGTASDHELTLYRRYEIGFIFQFYNLIPTLTALENIEVATEMARNPMDPEDALNQVSLKEFSHHFPSQLSGGQQQRVAIARAIACDPSMLLCDEPTGALDSQSTQQIIEVLKNIHKKTGKTIIMVTHERDLADYGSRVIEVKDGMVANIIDRRNMTQ